MYTINDPMFALILRFVGRNQKATFHDGNFIKEQLKEIQAHIDRFPPEEQELRALEWIEAHAHEYRKAWEKEIIGKEFSHGRCPDCPFATMDDTEHCGIHDEWLNLLKRYTADEITSKEYVENALGLIARHKEDLKIKLSMLKRGGDKLGGWILILGATAVLTAASPAQAQVRDVQSYANRQTFFNDVTDYFATLGKSDREKAVIEQKRHVARRKARLEQIREENKGRAMRRRE